MVCIPAEPASVSPGEVHCRPCFEECASSDLAARRRLPLVTRFPRGLRSRGRVDLSLSPGEHIERRHINRWRCCKAYGVCSNPRRFESGVTHLPGSAVCLAECTLIFSRFCGQRSSLPFELRIGRARCARGSSPAMRMNSFEIPGHELWSVVGDDPGFRFRIFSPAGSLQK